jgi:hypothetical protein
MMEPIDVSKSPLDKRWLRYVPESQIPTRLAHYIGIDPSPSEKPGSDFTGISIVGIDPEAITLPRAYLLAAYHIQESARAQVDHIKELAARWHPIEFLIEAVGAQSLFLDFLIAEDPVAKLLPIRKRPNPFVPKTKRILNMSTLFFNGTVVVRGTVGQAGIAWSTELSPHPMVQTLADEWSEFPAGHDDVLDSVDIALEAAHLQSAGEAVQGMIIGPNDHYPSDEAGDAVLEQNYAGRDPAADMLRSHAQRSMRGSHRFRETSRRNSGLGRR